MIAQLALVAALVAALAVLAYRRLRRARLARAARARAGSAPERAIAVRSFADMDEHLARRWCVCGGYLERLGEGSRDAEGRRLRVARLECQECGRQEQVFFDTTDVLH